MGIIKRSIHAVKGYIGTYIVLFFLVFIFSNIIVVSIGLNQESKNEISKVKSTIGIQAAVKSSLNSIREEGYYLSDDTPASQNKRISTLSDDYIALLEEIREVPGIEYLDYNYRLGYPIVENFYKKDMDFFYNELNLMGISTVEFRYLKQNVIKIVEGRNISDEEIVIGAPVGLIYRDYNLMNKDTNEIIKLGDWIKINDNNDSLIEIIGFYEGIDPEYSLCREEECPKNSVFVASSYLQNMNYKELENKTDNLMEIWSGSILTDVYIDIKDVDAIETIKGQINDLIDKYQSEYSYFELIVDSSQIDKLLLPLENLKSSTTITLYTTLFGSTIIIVFLEFYLLRKRKKEMGVLLSMGETKNNIILQLLSEVFFVGTFALLLSIGSSFFLIQNLAKTYFSDSFSYSVSYYVLLIILVFLSLILGVLIPSLSLNRLSPRNIMFEEE